MSDMFDEVNLITGQLGTINLIHADSDVHNPPTTYGYWLGVAPQFGGAPQLLFSERIRASIPGTNITPREHRGRDIVLPVVVRTATPEELPGAVNTLLKALDPLAASTWTATNYFSSRVMGLTTIEVLRSEAGSVTHSIDGYLIAGGSETSWRYADDVTVTLPLVFRCPFPYWEKGAAVTDSETILAGASAPAGAWKIPATTESDLPMWPTFTFDFASNKTTGQLTIGQTKFSMSSAFMTRNIAGPDVVTYVTRPDIRGVTADTYSFSLTDVFTPAPVQPATLCEYTLINTTSDSDVTVTVSVQPLSLTV